jgi:hypothetical protein
MSPTDPLTTVWEALEFGGYEPHGELHHFRARCPGHQSDNREALYVSEGADRRVLVYCHAHGCEPRLIVTAVGLTMSDLFPGGHHRARRRSLDPVRRSDLTGNAQAVASTPCARRVGDPLASDGRDRLSLLWEPGSVAAHEFRSRISRMSTVRTGARPTSSRRRSQGA